jgi:hypothetical protein
MVVSFWLVSDDEFQKIFIPQLLGLKSGCHMQNNPTAIQIIHHHQQENYR